MPLQAYKRFTACVLLATLVLIYIMSTRVEDLTRTWNSSNHDVHIWAKAAIGDYLWFHILGGTVKSYFNGFYKQGNLNFTGMTWYYLSGPGYIQTTVPQSVVYLILILNGRTPEKIENAKNWLEYLPHLKKLKKVAIVLHGSEDCRDFWITKYLKSKGGPVDVLFIIYDNPLVDNVEVFQWPLGVATYRQFPTTNFSHTSLNYNWENLCSFAGTVYKNSSREILKAILFQSSFRHKCVVLDRNLWSSTESKASLARYIKLLNSSEFTLCPVGLNTECYRLYEAMSLGSTPIVEDVMTEGNCVSPLRLLKKYKAPIISIKNWTSLNDILDTLINTHKKNRRVDVMRWYNNFKKDLAHDLITIIKQKFFHLKYRQHFIT